MTDQKGSSRRILATRVLGGVAGGFTWGLAKGLLDTIGFVEAVQLGTFMIGAGVLTAILGHFAFQVFKEPSRSQYLVVFVLLGIVFFGSAHLFSPTEYVQVVSSGSLISSIVGGAVGGLGGGIVYLVIEWIKE